MAFNVFLICGTDPSEQVAAWRLQTLANSYGMHVSVPNRNGSPSAIVDRVRRAIDQSDCVLAILTGNIGPAVATELKYALSKPIPVVAVVQEGTKVPSALGRLAVFRFSTGNSSQAEAEVMDFLRKQKLSKENLQSMAAFLSAGLGVFLMAALAER